MRVKCKYNKYSQIRDKAVKDELGKIVSSIEDDPDTWFTIGEIYDVYGLIFSTDNKLPLYLVCECDDDSYPVPAYPGFFDIVNDKFPDDWKFIYEGIDTAYYITPDFWANDPLFYDNLLEGEEKEVELFSKYKKLMANRFPVSELNYAKVLDENWVMCTKCDNVWKANKECGVILCEENEHRNNNPYYTE